MRVFDCSIYSIAPRERPTFVLKTTYIVYNLTSSDNKMSLSTKCRSL